jgi:hypothetical protein
MNPCRVKEDVVLLDSGSTVEGWKRPAGLGIKDVSSVKGFVPMVMGGPAKRGVGTNWGAAKGSIEDVLVVIDTLAMEGAASEGEATKEGELLAIEDALLAVEGASPATEDALLEEATSSVSLTIESQVSKDK